MTEWWENLARINQVFYGAAIFFSVFFVWQLISALMGLDGEGADDAADGGDPDADSASHHFGDGSESDAAETTIAFRLLSIRSIITFCTLFTWGGALYLSRGDPLATALGFSAIWGLVGMLSIAFIFWAMKKLTYTGTMQLKSCVGTTGTVYLDIPEKGFGEARLTVSGVVTTIKARTADGRSLPTNTPVRVIRNLGQTSVEVEAITS